MHVCQFKCRVNLNLFFQDIKRSLTHMDYLEFPSVHIERYIFAFPGNEGTNFHNLFNRIYEINDVCYYSEQHYHIHENKFV